MRTQYLMYKRNQHQLREGGNVDVSPFGCVEYPCSHVPVREPFVQYVIVHAELFPILLLGVPPEIGLEVDDLNRVRTNVNEVERNE
jgi:hypothetical protein